MTVGTFNPTRDVSITLTPRAAQHFLAQIQANPDQHIIRLSTTKTGCSGLAYVTELVNQPNADDVKAQTNSDLSIYIDTKSLAYLNGLTIDFVAGSLGQSKITYINPNETGKCGCGESFSVDPTRAQ